MIHYTDTHTHLYSDDFASDRTALIEKAISQGITRFYMPNIESSSIEGMLALEKQFPDHCFAMMGLHPCSVKANVEEELVIVKNWLEKRPFKAIGEIGMDLYWDKTFVKEQERAFRAQIDWALEYGYAIIIHCREAFDPIYEILTSYKTLPKGLFHCFSGNAEQAHKILALGNFKLGIGGVVTFKNSGLDKVVEQIGLEHLVLETDGPYLAPVPFRGKRNEPTYLLEVVKKIAILKNVDLQEVADATNMSSDFIFGSKA
jgi:TatD DNase family protein